MPTTDEARTQDKTQLAINVLAGKLYFNAVDPDNYPVHFVPGDLAPLVTNQPAELVQALATAIEALSAAQYTLRAVPYSLLTPADEPPAAMIHVAVCRVGVPEGPLTELTPGARYYCLLPPVGIEVLCYHQ